MLTAAQPARKGDMDANQVIGQVMTVEGQISPAESLLLFQLASKVTEGVILEVGSYRGRSTVALALGTRAGASLPVFAIEPHEPFQGALGGVFGPEDREHFFRNLLRAGVVTGEAIAKLRANGMLKDPVGAGVAEAVARGQPLSAGLVRFCLIFL